ncbi:DUF748 domain-containing protein [uncultured Sphaerotilus sp.]|uniref:DUF748 domain-containing protein n=1 Tax=uncultured Sphaerotilus sp. TaxID=474984 RepID=UPI0030CA147D
MTGLKRLGWAVLAVLGLLALAWVGVPPLLKSQIEQHASAALGRPVTVGRIDFKPWTLELTAEQFAIGAAPGAASAEPLLKIARLHADADLRSVLNLAPVLTALEIDQPELRLTRTAAGHYDIDDLIARFSQPAPAQPNEEPARFALHNVQLRGGAVHFTDQPLQREHRLTGLTLAVPFLSNLPTAIDTEVTSRLAFQLDGTAFDSDAKAKPFASQHPTQAQFKLNGFDLAPWLGYWPDALPVKLQRGKVSSELALHFEAPPKQPPVLRLSGRVNAEDLALTDRAGAALLSWGALDVALHDVQPLARQITLGAVTLDGLSLDVTRDARGRINLVQLGDEPDAAASTPATPWRVALDAIALQNTRVRWHDAGTQPAAQLLLDGLSLDTGPVHWPLDQPVTVKAATTLRGTADGAPELGRLQVQGQTDDKAAQLDLQLDQLALSALAPYLNPVLQPRLSGALSAQGQLRWAAAAGDTPMQLTLALQKGQLDTLRLTDPAAAANAPPLAALGQLRVDDAAVDVAARTVVLGKVQLVQPDTLVARDAKGQWNVAQWLVPDTAAPKPAAAPPWQITLKELQLQNGHLRYADAQAGTRAVQLDITQLAAGLQNVQLRGDHTLAPLRWQLSGNVAGELPRARPSKVAAATRTLDGRGELALQPLQVRGALRIDGFPVHAVEPYFGDALGLDLRRALLGYQGDLALQEAPAGWTVALRGDGRIGDLQLYTRRHAAGGTTEDADELLRWQTLTLQGLDVAIKPSQRPRVLVRELALDNFFSKLVITEDGRFNLQDVGASPDAAASAPAAAASGAAPAASAAVAAASASTDPPVDLTISATRISRGTVDFTDRFIQPNYSADLSELQGTLGEFRTGNRDMATLALRGKVQRTGSLDISGQINPTAQPLALDLRARATDLELTPLSPYAGKYAGYGIERGKLSMDVSYRIAPDGTLDAKNQIVINQLVFGDRVESPSATQLPVLLAVALLKDRNGVIDLNIPISGSINDPQFSVFGLALKVIGNVLTKAITAPFSFLSGGSSDDLSAVTFEPGTATLTAEGRSTADKVAQALTDRPALTLTLHGLADGPTEQDAYRAAALEKRLLAAAQRERAEAGEAPEAMDAPLSAEERTRLLRTLVRQLPKMPKPAPGKAAASAPAAPAKASGEPTDAELTATLAAAMPVSADVWRELAAQRGEAVRDALLARQLSNERIFLGAPKVGRSESDAAAWKPSAAMTLSAK